MLLMKMFAFLLRPLSPNAFWVHSAASDGTKFYAGAEGRPEMSGNAGR
jgi:hypothetical protein